MATVELTASGMLRMVMAMVVACIDMYRDALRRFDSWIAIGMVLVAWLAGVEQYAVWTPAVLLLACVPSIVAYNTVREQREYRRIHLGRVPCTGEQESAEWVNALLQVLFLQNHVLLSRFVENLGTSFLRQVARPPAMQDIRLDSIRLGPCAPRISEITVLRDEMVKDDRVWVIACRAQFRSEFNAKLTATLGVDVPIRVHDVYIDADLVVSMQFLKENAYPWIDTMAMQFRDKRPVIELCVEPFELSDFSIIPFVTPIINTFMGMVKDHIFAQMGEKPFVLDIGTVLRELYDGSPAEDEEAVSPRGTSRRSETIRAPLSVWRAALHAREVARTNEEETSSVKTVAKMGVAAAHSLTNATKALDKRMAAGIEMGEASASLVTHGILAGIESSKQTRKEIKDSVVHATKEIAKSFGEGERMVNEFGRRTTNLVQSIVGDSEASLKARERRQGEAWRKKLLQESTRGSVLQSKEMHFVHKPARLEEDDALGAMDVSAESTWRAGIAESVGAEGVGAVAGSTTEIEGIGAVSVAVAVAVELDAPPEDTAPDHDQDSLERDSAGISRGHAEQQLAEQHSDTPREGINVNKPSSSKKSRWSMALPRFRSSEKQRRKKDRPVSVGGADVVASLDDQKEHDSHSMPLIRLEPRDVDAGGGPDTKSEDATE